MQVNEILLADNMEVMRQIPDGFFELAIVDPPYGGGQHFNFRYGTGDQVYDSRKPDLEYFAELFRVSKNQIIWGGNYFTDCLPVSRCWVSWYKGQPIDSFSDFELAWTSFDRVSKCLKLESYGFNHADKKLTGNSTIHPTQKPVQLYKWLLKEFAKPGDKILDTHGGSCSSVIAFLELGFQYLAIERDPIHHAAACKRVAQYQSQFKLSF